ncbi:MAG TPA: hypothetical protein VJT74_07730 [Pyrinomonadaceae bacterium]|nr:hypothetical protein [Pyrinomonadaceae bacterium]
MAQAQATRTWVSGVGDDANPCSRTAPCKTFAGAISKTAAGGEIDALDPGGFGAVTITKAIIIDGGATLASILNSGTTGVIVNIGAAATDGRRVTLRRLSINGGTNVSLGLHAVRILAAREVNIENCYIQNQSTTGVKSDELAESGTLLRIVDTNMNNTGTGITTSTTTGFMLGVFDRVHISRMTVGIISKDRSFLTVRDSFISDSKGGAAPLPAGIQVLAPTNSNNLNLERTVLFSVGKGVIAGGNGTKVDLSNASFLNNTDAITTAGATLNSHGNNTFGNNTNPVVALTPLGQQ